MLEESPIFPFKKSFTHEKIDYIALQDSDLPCQVYVEEELLPSLKLYKIQMLKIGMYKYLEIR